MRKIIRRIKTWGYELIKHDFSTFDIFGNFGINLNGMITPDYGWTFHDKTKTSAEVILDFYRLLREEAGEMIIIGCNTISHLSAGMFELYRAGDDTSGKEWSRTRAYGINALAFRMCQNNAFYKGVEMIYRQLKEALNKEGVTEIDALDKEFDPNYHQAIMTAKVEGKKAGVVVEVLQKGYMLKDRILRASMVKVSE